MNNNLNTENLRLADILINYRSVVPVVTRPCFALESMLVPFLTEGCLLLALEYSTRKSGGKVFASCHDQVSKCIVE
jgi:hypothetical protein